LRGQLLSYTKPLKNEGLMRLLLSEAQQDEMRYAYRDGVPGLLVSGLVWATAAIVCSFLGLNRAVWTLLVGGVLISPISAVLTKATGRPGRAKNNGLNQLAMASTIWLILCCAMAYGLFLFNPTFFFPAMMGTIGCRYLVFGSVFGRATFWLIGGSLIVAGYLAFSWTLPPAVSAGLCGLIEVLFAVVLSSRSFKSASPHSAGVTRT
jgi:hypothetical protein